MIQFLEKAWTERWMEGPEGRMDTISQDPSAYRWGSKK